MPPRTKRQKLAHKQKAGSAGGRFGTVPRANETSLPSPIDESEVNDFEILEEAPENPTFNIEWNDNAEPRSRGKYWGNGVSTKYNRAKRAAEKAKGSHPITKFFGPAPKNDRNGGQEVQKVVISEVNVYDTMPTLSMQDAYERLTALVKPHRTRRRIRRGAWATMSSEST